MVIINYRIIHTAQFLLSLGRLVSRLFQELDLHLQVRLEVLVQDVLLDGGERLVPSVVVIRQQPLGMFDPHAVVTSAHAAVGRGRWWTLVRRPGDVVVWFCRLRGVR